VAKRILVYGVTGSGKTTFAKEVAAALSLPFHEADQLTWGPGWKQVPLELQRQRIQEIVDEDEWVLDTMYGTWTDIPLARAEVMIALDYPRWLSLSRLLRRSVARLFDQKEVCNGNTESFRMLFSRDSIVAWHFRSFARKRERPQPRLAGR
jgi:adenylate kinase family enzyme